MSDLRIDKNIDVQKLDKNKLYIKATAEYLAFLMEIKPKEWVWISMVNYTGTESKWSFAEKYPYVQDYDYGKIISTHENFEESIISSLKKYCMVFSVDNFRRFTRWYSSYGFDKAMYIRRNIEGENHDEDVISDRK